MKPHRIQRRRTYGFRLPPDAVYVGRGSKYGNPFRIHPPEEEGIRLEGNAVFTPESAVNQFRRLVAYINANEHKFPDSPLLHANLRRDLGGKVLACWCPTTHVCHADVLLELANKGE